MSINIPDSPIDSRAAWLGLEQSKRDEWIYVLSDAEKAKLDDAIRAHWRDGISLTEIAASKYPLPMLASAIKSWMRETG